MGQRETHLATLLNQRAPQAWLHLAQGMLGKDSSPTTTEAPAAGPRRDPTLGSDGLVSMSNRPSRAVAS